MLEIVKQESKNKEEALNKCLEELNVSSSEVYYYFEETEGGLFKGKKYTAVVTTKYAVKEYIKKFYDNKLGLDTLNIKVSQLIDNGQLTKLEDANGKACSGYVSVYLSDTNEIIYKPYLKCKKYETEGYEERKDS